MQSFHFLILIYLLLPILIIVFTEKNKIADKIGAVIIAYAAGLLLGHSGLLPKASVLLNHLVAENGSLSLIDVNTLVNNGELPLNDLSAYRFRRIQELFMTITIPLAIPLLLFSVNIKHWSRMAGKTSLSLFIAMIALIVMVISGFSFFRSENSEMHKVSGLLVGLYTGGTPNLAALKMMLHVDPDTYIKTHTYDTLISTLYILFILIVGIKIFKKILLPYPRNNTHLNHTEMEVNNSYKGIFKRKNFVPLLKALCTSILIFAIAGSLTLVIKNRDIHMLVVILTLTTLSIIVSTIRQINRINKTFELGMYFILVFSVVIASMADINTLMNISKNLFFYISYTIFGTLLLHVLLSKIFNIDADTVIITSTTLICSPPFVPMVAGVMKNKEIIVSGLTVGIIGYAIGNYLGAGLSKFLEVL